MNYQIIKDEEKLVEFINWLPDLLEDECYFVSLFARKKYAPELKSDKSQLKSFTSNKERLIQKIKQLECEVGSYGQGDIPIPQEALAIYINPNPRSNTIAAKNSLKLIADLITGDNKKYNLHREVLSQVQVSKGRSVFIDFDFDLEEGVNKKYIIDCISDILNKESFDILNTRGGFHLLIQPKKVLTNSQKINWYLKIQKIHQNFSSDIANKGDNMIPIPGCYQGGYVPNFELL